MSDDRELEEKDEASPPLPRAPLVFDLDGERQGLFPTRCRTPPHHDDTSSDDTATLQPAECDSGAVAKFPWHNAPDDTTTFTPTECASLLVSSSDSGAVANLDLKLNRQQQDTAAPSMVTSESRDDKYIDSPQLRARQRTMGKIGFFAELGASHVREQKMESTAINLFKKLDTDATGGLNLYEFEQLAKELGQRMTRVDLDTVRRRPHDRSPVKHV